MSLVPILGSLGLGLVCGWLAGLRGAARRRAVQRALALVGAALAVGLEVLLFAGWREVAAFVSGALAAWLVHIAWRRSLRRRFGEKTDAG